ncbi:LicD family protein [Enterococcus faecalis]
MVAFCEDQILTCFFCIGGCIGAIQSKGFIPWDDNLDFFILRPD